jgi:hypothetical protein
MNVSSFNSLLVVWPQSIIGSLMSLGPQRFFDADESKKQDVKVSF